AATSPAANRLDAELLGFEEFFRFTAEHPTLYRIIRQAEFVSPEMLRYHYDRLAEGYASGLAAAAGAGEIARLDAEVAAHALMGVAELVGMRFVLWGKGKPLPERVRNELRRLVRGILEAEGA